MLIQAEMGLKAGGAWANSTTSPFSPRFSENQGSKRSPSDTILCLELVLAPIAEEDRAPIS